jgi:hypothetical protein
MRHRDYDDLLDDYCRSLRVDPLLLDREWIDDLLLDAVRAYAQRRGSWRAGCATSRRAARFARSLEGAFDVAVGCAVLYARHHAARDVWESLSPEPAWGVLKREGEYLGGLVSEGDRCSVFQKPAWASVAREAIRRLEIESGIAAPSESEEPWS